MAVAVEADQGLQQGSSDGGRERDKADLAEVKAEGVTQHRINSGEKRLNGIVEKVTDTDCQEDFEGRTLLCADAGFSAHSNQIPFGGHEMIGEKGPRARIDANHELAK